MEKNFFTCNEGFYVTDYVLISAFTWKDIPREVLNPFRVLTVTNVFA